MSRLRLQVGSKIIPFLGQSRLQVDTFGTRFGAQRSFRSSAVNGTDENPTGPAIHQGQVTDTSLIWGRVFGNESQQSPRVYPPTGKGAKNPVGPHYESKVFFDKSLRSPDLLHAKDVNKFDLFMQIFKFVAKKGLIPAKE